MATTKKGTKTKKPSGIQRSRNGTTIAEKWKISDSNYGDGQQYKWRAAYASGKYSGWQPASSKRTIGAKVTSKGFTFSKSDYFPYVSSRKVKTFEFQVRGKRSDDKSGSGAKQVITTHAMSDWATAGAAFKVTPPARPTITQEWQSWPFTKFTLATANSASDSAIYSRMCYNTALIKDCSTTDGAKLKSSVWSAESTTTDASKVLSLQEDSEIFANDSSYTRWVRVKSQGPGGESTYRYAYHTYALPNPPEVTTEPGKETKAIDTSGGYLVNMYFTCSTSVDRPTDSIRPEWLIAEPDSNLQPAAGESWTAEQEIDPKNGTSGTSFYIDNRIGENQCLWCRAVAIHDDRTAPGEAFFLLGGKLSKPSDLAVTQGTGNYVTIYAENNAPSNSYLAVKYLTDDNPEGVVVDIIPSAEATSVLLPGTSGSVSVFAFIGSYDTITDPNTGVKNVTIDAKMQSDLLTDGGSIAAAPETVEVSQTATTGNIRVIWSWTWSDAVAAELSWSDDPEAWNSTEEPSTYVVSKARGSSWIISGLEVGKTWYVRVRLMDSAGDNATYSAYGEASINLASAPLIPYLEVNPGVVVAGGELTATWTYSTTDGTAQSFATIAEIVNGDYVKVAESEAAQSVTFAVPDTWATGTTHQLAVKVQSASGVESDDWSAPVSVAVAEPCRCYYGGTTLEEITSGWWDADNVYHEQTITALTELPLEITYITGAGEGGKVTALIRRVGDYYVIRPDETEFVSPDGETIAYKQLDGDELDVSFDIDDLIGTLDDGADYEIVLRTSDALGQVSDPVVIPFQVLWDHQASAPTATVQIVDNVAYLTPIAPAGYQAGDVCDIYRLSIDRPQLIYEGAEFGTTYVDPFPAIGEFGGHLFVTRTKEGDYIAGTTMRGVSSTDSSFAWYETRAEQGDILKRRYNIINFGTGEVDLTFNADISAEWQKDFELTHYLGGSIEGDWNPGIERTGTLTATAVQSINGDLMEAMRRLAEWSGKCQVRTKDGSSYPANVEVSENYHYAQGIKTADYSLKITRVDSAQPDGMTLQEWTALTEDESA